MIMSYACSWAQELYLSLRNASKKIWCPRQRCDMLKESMYIVRNTSAACYIQTPFYIYALFLSLSGIFSFLLTSRFFKLDMFFTTAIILRFFKIFDIFFDDRNVAVSLANIVLICLCTALILEKNSMAFLWSVFGWEE